MADVEWVLRKLKPLMPKRVREWSRRRVFLDAETRAFLDRQILRVAYRELGSLGESLLLSLPGQKVAAGWLDVGTLLYAGDRWPFGLRTHEVLQHVLIAGRSGSGKTNCALHLMRQLVNKGINVLFLDWKQTARDILPVTKRSVDVFTAGRPLAPFPFSPFAIPPGIEWKAYVNHAVDALAEAYTLGDGSRSVVQKCLAACYMAGNLAPTPEHVLAELSRLPDAGRVGNWKISAARALESVGFTSPSPAVTSQRSLVEKLLRSNTVLELATLDRKARRFLVPLLCMWLYHIQLASGTREQVQLVTFVEESHNVLYHSANRSHEPTMSMLLRQGREVGLALVVVDQHLHLIPSAALGNTYTTVLFNQKDPKDTSKAAALLNLTPTERAHLTTLRTGEAVVALQERIQAPVLVRTPELPIRKGFVTDDHIHALNARNLTLSGLKRQFHAENGQHARFRRPDDGLTDESAALVADILTHPDSGVDARYKRLGLSSARGHRIKEQLLNNGVLCEEVVPIGRTRKTLLKPTKHSLQTYKLPNHNADQASVSHEFWQRHYAQKYEQAGYTVITEAARCTGRADILALKPTNCVAIEIETGKSNAVHNIKADLLSKFDRVVVVATSQAAYDKVELQIAEAGLFIKSRVELVLRDQHSPEQ